MKSRIQSGRVARLLREFPIVVVIGMRQVGKTTLVQSFRNRSYVSLDDLGSLAAARADPEGFVGGLPKPVTIDEVQRAPELLLAIKRHVDRRRKNGEFLLTGSARIDLRRGIGDSLAGRAAVVRLRPMTWAERAGRADWNGVDQLFDCRSGRVAAERLAHGRDFDGSLVLAGGLPQSLLKLRGARRSRWLSQYSAAYLERDVPALLRVDEVQRFIRFLTLVASRTAQTTNYAALAHEIGISTDTALRWFGVIEATFLVDLASPYFRNIGKRLVKAPKLHFGDVGLAANLAGASTWREALRVGAAGAFVETLVAQHLFAYAEASEKPTSLFHYRTQAGAEVDFVLSRGPRLLPIEVKAAVTVRPDDVRGLSAFIADFRADIRFGVVLYAGNESHPVTRDIVAIPLDALLAGPSKPL